MKPVLVSIVAVFFYFSCTSAETKTDTAETTMFVLVRHAEKTGNTENPELSEVGRARAMKLAEVLSNVKFDAVYSTPFIRTKDTAAPIAAQQGLPVQEYDHREIDTLIPGWMATHSGQAVLIVGHSNSTPTVANAILGRENFSSKFDESDYGNILFITVSDRESRLLHLRY